MDESGINRKTSSFSMSQEKSKAIRKFLGTRACSTIYMRELQDIQDLLNYTPSQNNLV